MLTYPVCRVCKNKNNCCKLSKKIPVYILYNLIYSSLLRGEAAVDWPTTGDITGVPIPLTARIHQHQLPVKRNLLSTVHSPTKSGA